MQQVFVEPKLKQREDAGQKKRGGLEYEEGNSRARGVMSYIRSTGCFFAMTHQMRQDWDANGPIPNQYSAKRNQQVPGMVEVVLRLAKFCTACSKPNCQDASHVGRVHKARLETLKGNTGLEGLWVESLDFPTLYSFQNPRRYACVDIAEQYPHVFKTAALKEGVVAKPGKCACGAMQ